MEKSDAVITIRVPAAIKDALEDLARRDRRKLSAFCALKLEDVVAAAGMTPGAPAAPVVDDDDAEPTEAELAEIRARAVTQAEQVLADAETPGEKARARDQLQEAQWRQANPGKTWKDARKALRKAKK